MQPFLGRACDILGRCNTESTQTGAGLAPVSYSQLMYSSIDVNFTRHASSAHYRSHIVMCIRSHTIPTYPNLPHIHTPIHHSPHSHTMYLQYSGRIFWHPTTPHLFYPKFSNHVSIARGKVFRGSRSGEQCILLDLGL